MPSAERNISLKEKRSGLPGKRKKRDRSAGHCTSPSSVIWTQVFDALKNRILYESTVQSWSVSRSSSPPQTTPQSIIPDDLNQFMVHLKKKYKHEQEIRSCPPRR